MPEQNARRRRNARGPAALLVGGLMLTSLHASGAGAPTTEWTDASWSGAQTVAGSVQAGVVPTPTNVRCVGGGVLQNPTVHWEMPSGATSPPQGSASSSTTADCSANDWANGSSRTRMCGARRSTEACSM